MHRVESRSPGSLIGLLEILEDLDRPVDIAKLDDSLDEERTTLMNLLDDAESLSLIAVTNGDVSLTEIGRKFLKASIGERKKTLKSLLREVEPFHSLIQYYQGLNTREVPRDDLGRFLIENFPAEDNQEIFNMLINWGRYTKLLSYDSDVGYVVLHD